MSHSPLSPGVVLLAGRQVWKGRHGTTHPRCHFTRSPSWILGSVAGSRVVEMSRLTPVLVSQRSRGPLACRFDSCDGNSKVQWLEHFNTDQRATG